ncbi:MAG: hypothetical protein WDO17_05805 [Alphaproteobacteria bacterium]
MAKKAKKAKAKAKKTRKAKSAKKTVKRQVSKPGPKPASNDAGLGIVSVEATADLMPPGPFRFRVHARIEAPTPGFTAFLVKAVPQGINPAILILDVVLVKKPGTVIQVVTEIDADYADKNYKGKYSQVTVRYGKVTKTAKVEIVV